MRCSRFPSASLRSVGAPRGTLVLMGLAAVIAMLATPLAPSLFTGTTLFACLFSLQVSARGVSSSHVSRLCGRLPAMVSGRPLGVGGRSADDGIAARGGRHAAVDRLAHALFRMAQRLVLDHASGARLRRVVGAVRTRSAERAPGRDAARARRNRQSRRPQGEPFDHCAPVLRLLGNRNVLLLTLSYMTMNYVFI